MTSNLIKALLSASIFLLVSCASVPPSPSFSDVSAGNESKKIEYTRIQVDFDADCDDAGICQISEDTLNRLMTVITRMNDSAEIRAEAYNLSIDSLSHCQYGYSMLDRSLGLSEKSLVKTEITAQIKQMVTFLGCGALLFVK
jgi:hypothetical protein